MSHGTVNSIFKHGLASDSTLHVIGVCSNPSRFHSRYRIFRKWAYEINATKNVQFYAVEAAHGDRHHEVTIGCKNELQLRTNSEAWIKENMINLGVRYLLPKDWKHMAWVDGDVFFRDPNWALETIQQLQHYAVVQPWSECSDLNAQGGVSRLFKSFGIQHQRRVPKQTHPSQPYEYAHTGFAWACRRDFFEAVGGIPDYCVLGSADHHSAFAMIGEVDKTIHKGMSPSFFRKLREWQDKAMRVTQGEVGFCHGRIEHEFHGPKSKRYYRERWQILIDCGFDPDKHLMHDSAGVVQIVNNSKLEHEIRRYNRSRCEDSIEE